MPVSCLKPSSDAVTLVRPGFVAWRRRHRGPDHPWAAVLSCAEQAAEQRPASRRHSSPSRHLGCDTGRRGRVTCPPPHEAVLPHAGLGHLHLQHTEHEVLSHDIKVPRKWMFWRYGSRHLCQEQVSPAVRLDGATLSVTAEKKGPEMPWMPETPGRCYVGCPRRLGTCVSPWT